MNEDQEGTPEEEANTESGTATATETETPAETETTTATEAAPEKDFVPSEAEAAKNQKTRVGIVRSTSMDKTIVVEYTNRVPHPKFKKIIKQSKKFYAHDEKSEAAVGDKVRIKETKPISKLKRWELVEVLVH